MATCTFVWNTALAWGFTVAAVACAVADMIFDLGPLGRAGIMLAATGGCIHIRGWIAADHERQRNAFELGCSMAGSSVIRSVN